MEKILITGGAGFLGFHLAHYLSRKGYGLRIYDIAEIDTSEYPPEIEYMRADVRDRETLRKGLDNVYQVVHCAAALPLWSKKDIFTTNIDGTRNTLELSNELGAERVIFISSTAVYGIPKRHPIYEVDPV